MSLATASGYAVAAYPLDEASGNALDSVGTKDLTDNNTVGAGAGLIDGARDLERTNAESFSHADDAVFSFGNVDWTICLYINAESFTDGMGLISKWGAAGNREYIVQVVNSGGFKLRFFVSGDGTASTNIMSTVALSTATWYAVVLVHDSVNDKIVVYVNGTATSTTHSAGTYDGSATFYLGDDGGGDRFDGLVDELVILDGYAFTDADATEHYNSGAGVAFANWASGGGGGIVRHMIAMAG